MSSREFFQNMKMKEVRCTEYPSDAMDESLAGHEKNALWSLCGYWRVGILNPSCGAGAQGRAQVIGLCRPKWRLIKDSQTLICLSLGKGIFKVDKIETNLGSRNPCLNGLLRCVDALLPAALLEKPLDEYAEDEARVEIRWVHHPHYSPLVQFCRSWRGSKSVVSTQIAIRFLWTTQISGDDSAIDAVFACCVDSDALGPCF